MSKKRAQKILKRKKKILKKESYKKIKKKNTSISKNKYLNPPKMNLYQIPSIFPNHLSFEERLEILKKLGSETKTTFTEKYNSIGKWFTNFDPLYILSFCSFYFLSYSEGSEFEFDEIVEFPHFCLELLQAFSLMHNRNYLAKPLQSESNKFKDEMKEISELMMLRSFDIPDDISKERLTQYHFEWQVRNQTTAVRNWAYPHQMQKVIKAVFENTKNDFQRHFNLDPIKLITLFLQMSQKTEEKLNLHVQSLKKFAMKTGFHEMCHAYHDAFPDTLLIDDNEIEKLHELCSGNIESLKSLLLTHSDLKLPSIYTFSISNIIQMYGEEDKKDTLISIFDHWSLMFGDLKENNSEFFILDNPVWEKPFIKTEEGTYFSSIMGIFPHLAHSLLENMLETTSSLKQKYEKSKSNYLEEEVIKLFKGGFPNAKVFSGSKWQDPVDEKIYENDLIVIIDVFAIVVECKSGKMASSARRGGRLRLKETFQNLIVEPSLQASRFIKFLRNNKTTHCFKTKKGQINKFDNSKIKYYLPLTVTFENLGTLSCNIKGAIEAGIIEENFDQLSIAIPVTDLECIFDLLDLEADKIHYLGRRKEFEKNVTFVGDELDLLAFYIENGFNIGEEEFKGNNNFCLIGKSKELDPYFVGVSQDIETKKPSIKRTLWWNDILKYLFSRQSNHWLEMSFILLNVPNLEQKTFEKKLNTLKKKIKAGRVQQKHNWINFSGGPNQRKSIVSGFPYQVENIEERNSLINEIFDTNEAKSAKGVICLGIDLNNENYPYSILAMKEDTNLLLN
jgi:hypothetical protein